MTQVAIRVLKNGPYEVSGAPDIVDFEGNSYPSEEGPIYLCRCGNSSTKPFCDGTHKKVGFQATECVRLTQGR
jgi:CDGSH iron-sulfur domain-containing protein 3